MFCANCGKRIVKESTFCGACGAKIESTQTDDGSGFVVSNAQSTIMDYSNEQIEKMGTTIRNNVKKLSNNKDYLKPSDFKWAIILVLAGIAMIIYGSIRNGSTFLATNYIRIVNDYSYVIGAGWFFLIIGIIAFVGILYVGIRDQNQINSVREENDKLLNTIIVLSDNGNKQANCELGLFYRYGVLLEKDTEKAFDLFSKASGGNIAEAQYQLGVMYEDGIYVEKDDFKAIKWYTQCNKSLEGTSEFIANAYNKIGEFYRDGKAGLSVDYDIAFKYFEKATEHDTINAKFGFYNLGLAYQNGQGCKKDLNKASQYFDKAYDYGVEKAQNLVFQNTGGKY